jgi:DNA polymerase
LVLPPTALFENYGALVRARQACHACQGLINPADCDGGIHDSEQIGPWTLWQGNLRADLLVVGQDWGDTRYFTKNVGRDSSRNPTNATLVKLVRSIGIEIAAPTPRDSGGGTVFFTNAVLCLKGGGLQAKVKPEWFANCGLRFLQPTIDLIAPKVVVALGERAFKAIAAIYRLPRINFREAVDRSDGFTLSDGIRCFPMYHCGARILNTHRPMPQQLRDWERVGRALHNTAP